MSITIGKATIHNMDCMELLKATPDKFYDLACVDPPYGIGAATGSSTNKTMRQKIASGEIKGGNWDSKIPDETYFKELMRVSKNQIIWGGNYFPLPPSKCFFIWDKGESIYGRDFAECEKAWASFDKCARMIKLNPNQLDRIHPTQKPVKLYEWLLTNYAKQGDKILDTHGGSMSSVIACLNLGYEIVCTELDTDYYNAGVKRVEQSQKQQRMFE